MAGQSESVGELFEAALALEPSERKNFLDDACGQDSALRETVENLLAEDARAGSFLEHPAFNFLDGAIMQGLPIGDTTHSANSFDNPWQHSLEPGQILVDRFVIIRLIAKGGMGEVYEAEDRRLQGVHVALKTILPQVSNEPALQKRFEREVLLAREVAHPNLCPIYDIFHSDRPTPNSLFLTMKLLPGETVAARLHRPTPISTEEGSAILRQTALGLAAIHAAGIIHRDIKPNNIIVDGAGAEVRLWITDFGLAQALQGDMTLVGRGVAGTPRYIAPELLQGQPPSQASDLYAFGVVMHEVFTGQKPTIAPDNSSVIVSPRLTSSKVPTFCSHLIRECLEVDPKRRCQAFDRALESFGQKRQPRKVWTRRQFIGTTAAGVGALAVGGWVERETIYDMLHPLPGKRFVALVNWPHTSDLQVMPMLTGVLSAIKGELARIEAFDRDLFVISPEDVDQDLTRAANFKELCDPLGANLVLAASGIPGGRSFELLLRVLDPITGHALRAKRLNSDPHDMTALPNKAAQAAASLLNVSRYLKDKEPVRPGTQSVAAFNAFQTAESLMKQQNDSGLDGAIEKYREAVDIDPKYAIAYANLGIAYGRLYAIRHDAGALDLAHANCRRALTLDPNLVDGHLAMGGVFSLSGHEQSALDEYAKVLKLDPSNPMALVWQGQIFERLNRWVEAEQCFNRVLQERPNYWLAYHELGTALNGQGKYQEAIEKFRAATLAAPGNSQAFANLGGEYLQIGDFAQASSSLKKSFDLEPNDLAAVNTSLALRYQHKPAEALPYAQKAVEMNPTEDTNWLELGDCYSSLHNHENDAKAAYLRAAQEAEKHVRTDPTDGASVMLLALYRMKSGDAQDALSLLKKAERLGANDMDSQLYKARILELLGKRDEALATLAVCFRKGATALQFAPFPDMEALRQDPRYLQLLPSSS
jgi:tetratricopeptide (TPR) repeat protein/tRNA A-37 threonylcarbamoyl transferase component Bud32